MFGFETVQGFRPMGFGVSAIYPYRISFLATAAASRNAFNARSSN
jgi:hypothetical protein